VYSLAVVQQAAVPVPASVSVTGQGNYVWTFPNFGATLNVYAVGPGATPVASYAIGSIDVPIASATTIGVLQNGRGLSVIDLSGAAPVKVDYTLPVVSSINLAGPPTYAAVSASQWVLGNKDGVPVRWSKRGGTPRYLALGAVSIAGSTGHIAIATASGSIRYFNADTLVEEGVIAYSSSKVLLSSDGTLLAAEGDTFNYQYAADWSVKILLTAVGDAALHLALSVSETQRRATLTCPAPARSWSGSLHESGRSRAALLHSNRPARRRAARSSSRQRSPPGAHTCRRCGSRPRCHDPAPIQVLACPIRGKVRDKAHQKRCCDPSWAIR